VNRGDLEQLLAKIRISATIGFMSIPGRDLPCVDKGRASHYLTDQCCLKIPGEEARKEFATLNARNPLKNHVSDERIQGKPRKTNPPIPSKTKVARAKSGKSQGFPNCRSVAGAATRELCLTI
jgi:hypothetical protein